MITVYLKNKNKFSSEIQQVEEKLNGHACNVVQMVNIRMRLSIFNPASVHVLSYIVHCKGEVIC